MVRRLYRPVPPLDRYVDCLWYIDDPAASYPRERALPTGTAELVIDLSGNPMRVFSDDQDVEGQVVRNALVCGVHSKYFVLDTSVGTRVAGVHFRPGAGSLFLGAPGGELTNRHLALEDLWGAHARRLSQRMLEASSIDALFSLLERTLLACLTRSREPHPAVTYALRECGRDPSLVRIEELQRTTGYSAKRFIELFRDGVGLTPKSYCRIRRFQAVIDSLTRGEQPRWASVAVDGGYADQSHLNRDFRAFAGVTPGSYRPVSADRPNHVAIES